MYALTRMSSPLVTPPSSPPAWLVGRVRAPVGAAGVARPRRQDLVVHLRARAPGGLRAEADADRLDRRDRHQRLREPAVEPAVPLGEAAEAGRHAVGHDLEDAAQRVAGVAGRVDGRDHPRVGVSVQRSVWRCPPRWPAMRVEADRAGGGRRRRRWRSRGCRSSTPMAASSWRASRAGGDARRRFPRARPFEDVAQIVVAVLQRAGEVGVARPRTRDRRAVRAAGVGGRLGIRVHGELPVDPVAVVDGQRHRRTGGPAVADARHDRPPCRTRWPSGGRARSRPGAGADRARWSPGSSVSPAGNALDDHDQRAAVRLAGCEKTQHARRYSIRNFCTPSARDLRIPAVFRRIGRRRPSCTGADDAQGREDGG